MGLVFENVSKTVGAEPYLYETSFSLESGSLNVVFGPTLAGKTSLLRLMAGLDRPTTGRVLVDGQDVTGMSVGKRDVGMVYQQFINYPSLNVYENIASPLRRAGVNRREVDRRVRQVAETLGLETMLRRLPAELSGGQQQRTALARALVKEARLVLLDEPLVNLDYKLREQLRGELKSIFRSREAIVVYATMEPSEALTMGGNVLVVAEGELLQTGPTHEVYKKPATMRVGEVFSDPPINLIAGRVDAGEAKLGGSVRFPLPGYMRGLSAGEYRFGLRAGNLNLQQRNAGEVSISGVVDLAEMAGSETFLHVTHDGVSWIAQEEGLHPHSLGAEIKLSFDPANLYVFDSAGRLTAAPHGGETTT